MDDIKPPSPSDRIVKVGRRFEWSRLENELMTSAYERVLPVGRSVRAESSVASHERGCDRSGRSNGGRPRYATGA
jgi:hypothetical protein